MNREYSRKEILEMIKTHQITPEEGLRLFESIRRVQSQATGSSDTVKYYTVQWEKAELRPETPDKPQSGPDQPGTLLVFGSETELKELFRRNRTKTSPIIGVIPAQAIGWMKLGIIRSIRWTRRTT